MSNFELTEPRDRTFRSDGLTLHYGEWGNPDRETFILVHGMRDQCRSWDFFVSKLFDKGVTDKHIVALDLRGHGDSDPTHPNRGYQYGDFVLDLAVFIRYLNKKSVSLIGHSLGGGVCLLFTGSLPAKVRRLILIEAMGPMVRASQDVPDLMAQWMKVDKSQGKIVFYRSLKDASRAIHRRYPLIPEKVRDYMAQYGTRQTKKGYVWKYDPRVRFPTFSNFTESQIRVFIERIKCPNMLIFGGDGDFKKSSRYQRITFFKSGEVVEIPGAGHHIPHEKPHELVEVITPFLKNSS